MLCMLDDAQLNRDVTNCFGESPMLLRGHPGKALGRRLSGYRLIVVLQHLSVIHYIRT